jgi:hypothetical protein
MATTVRPSDSIDVLDLPSRIYHALKRNDITTIGALCSLSEVEFLRMRNVGPGSLEELKANLAAHRLSPPTEPPPPPDPALAGEAAWVGRQIDALVEDDRVYQHNRLGTKYEGEGSELVNRRRAWAFYRWGTAPEADWPRDKAGGFGYMAVPMPGSLELHLEGLNRLAREELGSE